MTTMHNNNIYDNDNAEERTTKYDVDLSTTQCVIMTRRDDIR